MTRFNIFTIFSLLFLVLSVQARPVVHDEAALLARADLSTLDRRATLLSQAKCTSPSTKLNSHDCNVALLSVGTGIAGKIQFLRVAGTTTTGRSGDCAVTVTAINGGKAIDISKGRFEQGVKSLKAVCGVSPGTVDIQGGSTGGDVRITMTKNA